MTRDIEDRIRLFSHHTMHFTVRRLALNMDQIEQYDPPPNPAKETDARYANYAAQYGDSSWELDALEPQVLSALVEAEVETIIDEVAWRDVMDEEQRARDTLQQIADRYDDVVEFLSAEDAS